MDAFIAVQEAVGRFRSWWAGSWAALVEYLRLVGVPVADRPRPATTAADALLARYSTYEATERGLRARTIERNLHALRGFVESRLDGDVLTLQALTASEVTAFVVDRARRVPSSVPHLVAALRSHRSVRSHQIGDMGSCQVGWDGCFAYGDAMPLSVRGCQVSADQEAATRRGLAAMDMPDASVTVTATFVEDVATATGDRVYSAGRGGGLVAARTVSGVGGSRVFVNHGVMAMMTSEQVERLFAHEAGHVQIHARGGEELAGYREAQEADWQWMLKCLAGLAMVELRIERRLAELDYPPSDSAAGMNSTLNVLNLEIVGAVCDPASATNPDHLYGSVMGALDHFSKALAYAVGPLAAGRPGFSPTQLSTNGRLIWDDYVAGTWQRRLDLWRTVPPSSSAITERDWRATLHGGAAVEEAMLRDVGFRCSSDSEGWSFRRTGSDELFTQRLERARAWNGAPDE